MSNTVRKVFELSGLDCANCATKVEREVKNINGVKSATVDFISRKLVLEFYNEQNMDDVSKAVVNTVKAVEPDIKIIDGQAGSSCNCGSLHNECTDNNTQHGTGIKNHNNQEKNETKSKLIRIGGSALLFGLAIISNLPFWAELGLFLISYLLIGGEILAKAFKNITRGQVFDENFLMAVATVGAFAIKEFPEGVAVMLFYQIGEFFQEYAVNHSRKSIKALMDIRPDFANLKQDGEIKRVSPEQITVGNIIIVKPGEKVPLDGKVLEGSSVVDTAVLTGESVPRDIVPGDEIMAGFINKGGLLTVEVTKEFGETTVSKILDLVQNAGSRKSQTENFITRFARYYTPAVVVCALLIAVLPPLLVPGAGFSEWINRALVFLVVSCPCALVVSIPLGFFGGIGGASRNGILVKGSNYLEALNNIDTIIFDKTGTLTKGTFKVSSINPVKGNGREELLKLAAYAESYSNHPIALSILKAYDNDIDKDKIAGYDEMPGYGTKAVIENKTVLAGNIKLMKRENIKVDEVQSIGTVVYLAVDGEYAGNIIISDEIKQDAKLALENLRKTGVKKLVMLTGDNREVGNSVAKSLGIDNVYSELLPDQKVEKLEEVIKQKSTKGKVIFVGDGINDAPVLARADIGVAMGGMGSDAAIEAADVILMTDEPSKLVTAIKIAKKTKAIVWQNIVFALGVKALVLVLGAGGIATMWEAVFADVGVALIAIFNAMRVMGRNVVD